jgi:hypothetical protein
MSTVRLTVVVIALIAVMAAPHANAAFPACTMHNNTLDTGDEPIGHVRMALRPDGTPVLVYETEVHNSSTLHFYDCANRECSSGTSRLLDSSYNYYGDPGIVVRGDGRPVIAASHRGGLRLYDCSDAACTSATSTDIVAEGAGVLSDTPLLLQANGNPVLLYLDGSIGERPGWVISHFCADVSCVTGGREEALAAPATNSWFDAMSLAMSGQGMPVAAYYGTDGPSNSYGIFIGACSGNPACSSVTTTRIAAPVSRFPPLHPAVIVRSDQRPLVLDDVPAGPALLDCTTPQCTSATRRDLPASAAGQPLGLALLPGDEPAFALFGNEVVGAFACADAACSNGTAVSIGYSQSAIRDGDFKLDTSHLPVIAYIDSDAKTLGLARCTSDVVFADGFDEG